MSTQTSAGTTIALTASAPATYDVTGFAALTPTLIGEVTDAGELGREYELVTHQPLATRRTVKKKGTFNDGAMTLQLGKDLADAGQILLDDALDDDADYYFEVTFQDGGKAYFAAQVMSFKTAIGGANSILGGNTRLEITNDIIFDAP